MLDFGSVVPLFPVDELQEPARQLALCHSERSRVLVPQAAAVAHLKPEVQVAVPVEKEQSPQAPAGHPPVRAAPSLVLVDLAVYLDP